MKFLRILPLVLLLACEKEGPIGPQGQEGNANVSSGTFTVAIWQYNEPSYYADIFASFITDDIVQSGAVLVYAQTGINQYTQLPLTFYQSTYYSTSLEVSTSTGSVRIIWTDSDRAQPIEPQSLNFKVVAIAASVLRRNPNVDLNNYAAVEKAFSPQ